MKKFHTISLLLGGFLLILLIWSINPGELWHNPGMLCSSLAAILLLEGVAGILATLAWRHCLSNPHRNLTFFHTYRIYIAGNAINYLTPTAALGGELTKATLLSDRHKGPEAVTAVIVGKLAHALAQLLLVIAGSLTILSTIALPFNIWLLIFTGSILLGAGLLLFLAGQKTGRLGAVIRWMVKRNFGGASIRKAAHHVTKVDLALKEFYVNHPRGLTNAILWHMASLLCGFAQYWVFFLVFAPDATTLHSVAGVWLLGSWMDLVAFALPNDIGILEGTRIIAFKTIGFTASFGLTFGIIFRLAQIFWGAAGLILYATLMSERKKFLTPETQKTQELSS